MARDLAKREATSAAATARKAQEATQALEPDIRKMDEQFASFKHAVKEKRARAAAQMHTQQQHRGRLRAQLRALLDAEDARDTPLVDMTQPHAATISRLLEPDITHYEALDLSTSASPSAVSRPLGRWPWRRIQTRIAHCNTLPSRSHRASTPLPTNPAHRPRRPTGRRNVHL